MRSKTDGWATEMFDQKERSYEARNHKLWSLQALVQLARKACRCRSCLNTIRPADNDPYAHAFIAGHSPIWKEEVADQCATTCVAPTLLRALLEERLSEQRSVPEAAHIDRRCAQGSAERAKGIETVGHEHKVILIDAVGEHVRLNKTRALVYDHGPARDYLYVRLDDGSHEAWHRDTMVVPLYHISYSQDD